MRQRQKLPLVIINRWHALNKELGLRFTVSEAATAQLFTAKLIESGYCKPTDLCPESFYLDGENAWRRIDLLIGKDMLFETGKKRTERAQRIQSAIEMKVESAAITLKPTHIELDCEKLERFAREQLKDRKGFSMFALFRAKTSHLEMKGFWKAQSLKNKNVRIVICFPGDGGIETHHYHAGNFWDLGKNDGNFYRGWELP